MQTPVSSSITARIVHLWDNARTLQVIFSDTNILDFSALTRITKRRLEPITHFNKLGDTLTRTSTMLTFIDKGLLQKENISLRYSPQADLSEMPTKEFVKLFSNFPHSFDDFTILPHQIPQISTDYLLDESRLQEALGRFQSIRLKQRLEETLELPPLPITSQKIIQLCSKRNVDTDELCDVISIDPSLTAQVISWASSPYYGAPGNIASVEDAIIRVLGFDMVMNLALGLSMKSVLTPPKNGPRHYQNFWFNSAFRASLMETLVKRMPAEKRPRIGYAYLSGLLHNFGHLAIGHILPTHFSILSRHLEGNAHVPTELIEMHLLRFTKEQLGSWLLRHWGLPDDICNAIRYAKAPDLETTETTETVMLAYLLQCSHHLCHHQTITAHLSKTIGLSEEECLCAYQEVQSSSNELQEMVSLLHN
ncbi:HDOD domain-containing protein [Marinomonas sp. 2405UD68-3]|uniref:HDOD domain-containing protein n=1 Tax=Marinomonas sp. 2405UD68-3 TaxID=3391835 RepID=UPI0039C9CBAE